MSNVIDLAARLALHESVRPFLTILGAAPKVSELLEEALPSYTKEQQRVLLSVLTWRLMGAHLPASVELLRRLPLLHGLHPESIQAAFTQMCDVHVLVFQSMDETGEGYFVWPSMEQIIVQAVAEQDAPKIITPDNLR